MGVLSIRIPDSLHKEIKKVSKEDNISINQFVATAVSEKITALETEQYLSDRAKLSSKEAYKNVLSKVPSNMPEEFDR